MKPKEKQINKKAATVALVFLLLTILYLSMHIVWLIGGEKNYFRLFVAVVFFVAGVMMVYNEFHKKPRRHVEDVKKYIR